MREIKFRVWDTVQKRFLKTLAIRHDGTLKVERFDGSLTRADKAERFVLQLYTGLKDKNGVEIYEGDIVATDRDKITMPSEYHWQVIWATDVDDTTVTGWFVKCLDKTIGDPEHLYVLDKGIMSGEVIGNIYENPELLALNPNHKGGNNDE